MQSLLWRMQSACFDFGIQGRTEHLSLSARTDECSCMQQPTFWSSHRLGLQLCVPLVLQVHHSIWHMPPGRWLQMHWSHHQLWKLCQVSWSSGSSCCQQQLSC
jgi:hypothetical protein